MDSRCARLGQVGLLLICSFTAPAEGAGYFSCEKRGDVNCIFVGGTHEASVLNLLNHITKAKTTWKTDGVYIKANGGEDVCKEGKKDINGANISKNYFSTHTHPRFVLPSQIYIYIYIYIWQIIFSFGLKKCSQWGRARNRSLLQLFENFLQD